MAFGPSHLYQRIGGDLHVAFFEGMAMTTFSKFAEPVPPKRLCFLYFPNGVGLPPKESVYHKNGIGFHLGEGTHYKLTKSLSPLSPYKSDISIMGGLSHPYSRNVLGHMAGDSFLTGGDHGVNTKTVFRLIKSLQKIKPIYPFPITDLVNRWWRGLQVKNLHPFI